MGSRRHFFPFCIALLHISHTKTDMGLCFNGRGFWPSDPHRPIRTGPRSRPFLSTKRQWKFTTAQLRLFPTDSAHSAWSGLKHQHGRVLVANLRHAMLCSANQLSPLRIALPITYAPVFGLVLILERRSDGSIWGEMGGMRRPFSFSRVSCQATAT